jgi:group I intron endonuclease
MKHEQILVHNNLAKYMGKPVSPLKTYTNLHDPEVLQQIRDELRGKPVIYVFHLNNSKNAYVGQTIQPEVRFYNHLSLGRDSNLYLQNSFKKHGLENFTLYIVQFVELPPNSSKEEVEAIMIAAEQKFMDLLEPAYNFSKFAGKSRIGTLHSETSKQLMSERRRGKNKGKEPINKGTKLTDEH